MEKTELTAESTESLLLQIKEGDESLLRKLYEDKRPRFIRWFQKNYSMDKEQAIELFQKAFSIFYFNVKDGKIIGLRSTIDTYMYGIGKMLVKEQFRQTKKNALIDDIPDVDIADYSIFHAEEITHQQTLVRKILNSLMDPCKTVLQLYYFQNFSLESIALRMGYKSENVVKKKKSLCLKHIREQLLKTNLTM